MKMYNSVGCSIEGLSSDDVVKFRKAGWISEEEYLEKIRLEEQDDEI